MTAPGPREIGGEGPEPPQRPYALQLDAAGMGTLLGGVAWVLGALQIMRDRGHADASEELHDLEEALSPRLERLLEDLGLARAVAEREASGELASRVEAAYGQVRAAFERWIVLTASDTASVAIGQRISEIVDTAVEEAGEPPDEW